MLFRRCGWSYGGPCAHGAYAQAALDQFDILRSKWQGSERHLHEVVRVPVRLHHAGLGVPRDCFQQVSDLKSSHGPGQ